MLKSRFTFCPWSRFFAHRSLLDPCLSWPPQADGPLVYSSSTALCPAHAVSTDHRLLCNPTGLQQAGPLIPGANLHGDAAHLLQTSPETHHLSSSSIPSNNSSPHVFTANICFNVLPPTSHRGHDPRLMVQGPRGFFLLHFRAFENQLPDLLWLRYFLQNSILTTFLLKTHW